MDMYDNDRMDAARQELLSDMLENDTYEGIDGAAETTDEMPRPPAAPPNLGRYGTVVDRPVEVAELVPELSPEDVGTLWRMRQDQEASKTAGFSFTTEVDEEPTLVASPQLLDRFASLPHGAATANYIPHTSHLTLPWTTDKPVRWTSPADSGTNQESYPRPDLRIPHDLYDEDGLTSLADAAYALRTNSPGEIPASMETLRSTILPQWQAQLPSSELDDGFSDPVVFTEAQIKMLRTLQGLLNTHNIKAPIGEIANALLEALANRPEICMGLLATYLLDQKCVPNP